ncbi:MAG: putative oxidoreductase YncB, partial [Blastococcus sp.]|nr:putative oxidoreductase YncB [Blastococcus sp.]
MDEPVNRQVVLRRLPDGALEIGDFELREAPVPRPGPGEVLCRTVLASPDPVHRLHMRGASYRGSLRPGDVMAGFTLCRVVDPNGTGVETGTLVTCEAGWQDYAVMPVHHLLPVRGGGELTHHMSVLGVTGLTAYFGLIDVGRPRPGETVVVSAAAGATGNVAGQLARIAGARVVGVTGSTEKRQLLEEVLGFEATVDHRSPTFARDLSTACPDGIDVYF